jgi:hypothetical protein
MMDGATTAVTLVVRPARLAAQVTATPATVVFAWVLQLLNAIRSMGASAQKQDRNKSLPVRSSVGSSRQQLTETSTTQ